MTKTFNMNDVMRDAYDALPIKDKNRIHEVTEKLQEDGEAAIGLIGFSIERGEVVINSPQGSMQLANFLSGIQNILGTCYVLSSMPVAEFTYGQSCYFVDVNGSIKSLECDPNIPSQRAMILMGNLFHSKEQAENNRDRVLKQFESMKKRGLI